MMVVISHLTKFGLIAGDFPLDDLGHESVVSFFVLSGMVISHAASRPGTTLASFIIARGARLYSVVVPAIVLCYSVPFLMRWEHYEGSYSEFMQNNGGMLAPLSTLLFLNESWFRWQEPPWNGPFWSLCYEAWYYVIFGLSMFLSGWRRTIAVLVACLIAGPRILLLFPIWLLGVWMIHRLPRTGNSPVLGILIWVGSILMFVVLGQSAVDLLVRDWIKEVVPQLWVLKASELFVTDYLFAGIVAANFLGFQLASASLTRFLTPAAPLISWLAGTTFTLYLFHYPMLEGFVLLRSHFAWLASLGGTGSLLLVVIVCVLVSFVTERQRDAWRTPISWILNAFRAASSRLGLTCPPI